ncbi:MULTISPECIES: protein-L-isoaspartate carboxylmethyltransferase [unclassified Microbacterium]|uniref:protein-L-isoaspartate carboxylmethyltransferase n=1 Tax=unclassified Microbacterium TaxID=2609290 RepID=UPI0030162C65
MPYRNQATVQAWVDDYLAARPEQGAAVTVLEKDFTPGPESGLVVVGLRNASTITYMQPTVVEGLPCWMVTFEARSDAFDLDAAGVARLSSDLAAVAALCEYLQHRTDAAIDLAADEAAGADPAEPALT